MSDSMATARERVLAELPDDGRRVAADDVVRGAIGDGVSTAAAWCALGVLCAEGMAEVKSEHGGTWTRRLPRDGRAG